MYKTPTKTPTIRSYFTKFDEESLDTINNIVSNTCANTCSNHEEGEISTHHDDKFLALIGPIGIPLLIGLFRERGYDAVCSLPMYCKNELIITLMFVSEEYGKKYQSFHQKITDLENLCFVNCIPKLGGRNLYSEIRGSFQSVQYYIRLLNDFNSTPMYQLCGRMTEVGGRSPPYFGNWGTYYEGETENNWEKKDGKWVYV